MKARQVVEEFIVKQVQRLQVLDILICKMQVLDILDDLVQTSNTTTWSVGFLKYPCIMVSS